MASTMEVQVSNDTDTESKEKGSIVIYRCKKCRRIVASQDHIIPHERGNGQKCFKWKKRTSDTANEQPPECSSMFVEPMKWMQAGEMTKLPFFLFSLFVTEILVILVEEGNVEQKLQCIGCNARLGSFNWAGMQCNCGAWVNPAFQLHKSRVDECPF